MFLQAQKGNTYFIELAERVESGNYARRRCDVPGKIAIRGMLGLFCVPHLRKPKEPQHPPLLLFSRGARGVARARRARGADATDGTRWTRPEPDANRDAPGHMIAIMYA